MNLIIDATCKITCNCPFLPFFLDLAWDIPKKQLWLRCPAILFLLHVFTSSRTLSDLGARRFSAPTSGTTGSLTCQLGADFFLSGLRSTETFGKCNWSSGNMVRSIRLAETVCFAPLQCTPDKIIVLARKDHIEPGRVQIYKKNILLMEAESSVKTLKIKQNKTMKILQRKNSTFPCLERQRRITPSWFVFWGF